MSDLSADPITKRWPAEHPDRLQLYSLPTPNGVKASIMLEESGLPYEAHLVSFGTDDQMIGMDDLKALEDTITAQAPAGGRATFHVYEAGHAFFNDENPLGTYDPEAAELAWNRTLEALSEELGSA